MTYLVYCGSCGITVIRNSPDETTCMFCRSAEKEKREEFAAEEKKRLAKRRVDVKCKYCGAPLVRYVKNKDYTCGTCRDNRRKECAREYKENKKLGDD